MSLAERISEGFATRHSAREAAKSPEQRAKERMGSALPLLKKAIAYSEPGDSARAIKHLAYVLNDLSVAAKELGMDEVDDLLHKASKRAHAH